ncbi:IS66-like element accessory protein TnpA [Agrobacterium sp. NPDC090273]|uniref:IS66-like element accessory protein TnpA n=1 Tax=Agrobacterium sp. NPDC090273 TaxID=3363919 RepID=UPI00383A6388
MTKQIEVITSVQRRRRWSREEKEHLVAACLEPGAIISEIARDAGVHGSQLFRWRKELCRIEAPSMQVSSRLVPVVVSEAASALPGFQSVPPATHPRQKRSDVTIELGRGRSVHVDSDIDTEALGRILHCVMGLR